MSSPSRGDARLKVLSAGAIKYVATGFGPRFTQATGDTVDFTFGTIGGVRKRLSAGEKADVIMGTAPAIADMEQSGIIVAGTRRELGRTLTGICVRAGAPIPDISTPESFKQAMLAARSVAYTNPEAGGTSGIYLVGLLGRLGIADAVGRKSLLCVNGDDVVEKVLSGEAELGSTFISEIVPIAGVALVGALPAAIENATTYAAGVMAGSARQQDGARFIAMLTAPAERAAWMSLGFEPAGRG
ncbi:MAG: substrate-binding domain-containing protein [Hyphomicrobiales bacterium]|nr:substrate-binding domain-containing protein [Hyphomicrobiales bacterium]